MALRNLKLKGNRWVVDGIVKACYIGRDSFKLCNMLSKFFTVGDTWEYKSEKWIERNQKIFGQNVILRTFNETGFWSGHPMFGAEPADAGIWDIKDLQKRSARGQRIKELTSVNKRVLEWLMNISHTTGVAFELVVDATLKHGAGDGSEDNEWLRTPIADHAIRQVCSYLRELYASYSKAKIIVEARNEWRAHNKMRTKLREVNMWAERFYRWEREVDGDTEHKLAFGKPGPEWICRQWPEGFIIVDGTDDGVNIGHEPGRYKMGLTHPARSPEDRKWWELPTNMEQLRADSRGTPLGFNESMMIGQKKDESRLREWYGRGGWTVDLEHYLQWYETCINAVEYFILHDELGMSCDPFHEETDLEAALGGIGPTPTPPPPEDSTDYTRIIDLAYRQVLGRPPDMNGLRGYNRQMRLGLTEAVLREDMIRSVEFRNKNSD